MQTKTPLMVMLVALFLIGCQSNPERPLDCFAVRAEIGRFPSIGECESRGHLLLWRESYVFLASPDDASNSGLFLFDDDTIRREDFDSFLGKEVRIRGKYEVTPDRIVGFRKVEAIEKIGSSFPS